MKRTLIVVAFAIVSTGFFWGCADGTPPWASNVPDPDPEPCVGSTCPCTGDDCSDSPLDLGADDTDSDGIDNSTDNCPDNSNEDQADTDTDGRGNVCDNCPAASNADQLDTDGDGVGDVCETTVTNPTGDDDSDGVINSEDNCSANANADQADGDSDGVGDACDNCPEVPNNDQANNGGDCDTAGGGGGGQITIALTSGYDEEDGLTYVPSGKQWISFTASGGSGQYEWSKKTFESQDIADVSEEGAGDKTLKVNIPKGTIGKFRLSVVVKDKNVEADCSAVTDSSESSGFWSSFGRSINEFNQRWAQVFGGESVQTDGESSQANSACVVKALDVKITEEPELKATLDNNPIEERSDIENLGWGKRIKLELSEAHGEDYTWEIKKAGCEPRHADEEPVVAVIRVLANQCDAFILEDGSSFSDGKQSKYLKAVRESANVSDVTIEVVDKTKQSKATFDFGTITSQANPCSALKLTASEAVSGGGESEGEGAGRINIMKMGVGAKVDDKKFVQLNVTGGIGPYKFITANNGGLKVVGNRKLWDEDGNNANDKVRISADSSSFPTANKSKADAGTTAPSEVITEFATIKIKSTIKDGATLKKIKDHNAFIKYDEDEENEGEENSEIYPFFKTYKFEIEDQGCRNKKATAKLKVYYGVTKTIEIDSEENSDKPYTVIGIGANDTDSDGDSKISACVVGNNKSSSLICWKNNLGLESVGEGNGSESCDEMTHQDRCQFRKKMGLNAGTFNARDSGYVRIQIEDSGDDGDLDFMVYNFFVIAGDWIGKAKQDASANAPAGVLPDWTECSNDSDCEPQFYELEWSVSRNFSTQEEGWRQNYSTDDMIRFDSEWDD